MQVLNLEEKNTERMDAINKFTLMDSDWLFLLILGWLFQADSNNGGY